MMPDTSTTPRNHAIDYIEFTSPDLEATRRFYETVFGWHFTDYGPDYTSFHTGPEPGGTAGGFARSATPPASSGPLVVLFVDDLEATDTRVREAGGIITQPIFSFPGGSRFHFTDPGGNCLAAWHEG